MSRVGGRSGESFISPSEQRRKITGWAESKGLTVAGWHEDLDVSGGTRDRPGLNAAIQAVKDGRADGIVVARLDRLSRLGVADALSLVEEIHTAGGTIAALDLGIDPTTPFGELSMTLMLALGRMERRRITDGWRAAQESATARGVHIGPTPLGYARGPDSVLIPCEPEATHVFEAFEAAVTGGVSGALDTLRNLVPQRAWSTTHARRFLATRAYLGEVSANGQTTRDAHPALVTRETWEAAQPGRAKQYKRAEKHPLAGLATCAHCDTGMTGTRDRNAARRLRCPQCSQSIDAQPVELAVREALALASESWVVVERGSDAPSPTASLAAAEAELEAYAEDIGLAESLGHVAFAAGARARATRIAKLREEVAAVVRDSAQRLPAPDVIATATEHELRTLVVAVEDVISILVERGRGHERVSVTFA